MADITPHTPRQHQQEILDPRLPILQLLHLVLEFLHWKLSNSFQKSFNMLEACLRLTCQVYSL